MKIIFEQDVKSRILQRKWFDEKRGMPTAVKESSCWNLGRKYNR